MPGRVEQFGLLKSPVFPQEGIFRGGSGTGGKRLLSVSRNIALGTLAGAELDKQPHYT